MADDLEIKLVVENTDILKIEGGLERDESGFPISIIKPKYTYASVEGNSRAGNVNLIEAFNEVDLIGEHSGRDYTISIQLKHIIIE